ncbi:MAG TPA: YafY family protein [Pseudonocardiaceae bacterium]|nr:YafY family protein [Pseudonocardiaceae bacterium]
MSKNMPARMLRLLSLLQTRREWSGAELADRLGVTDRTVRRDIDRLRELGYPVDATTGTAGGYRLASGRDLPPLLLEDDEAVAIAVGLRTASSGVHGVAEAAVRALAKLEQVLPARLRAQVAAVGSATVAMPEGTVASADPETVAVLAIACRDHELVSFDYRRRDGTATHRRVEPHSLVTAYRRWLLLAFDPEADDWRIFRVDRITAPTPTRWRFTPRPLPDGDAAAYVGRSLAAAPYRYNARVTVRASAERVLGALSQPLPGKVIALDAERCEVRCGADDLKLILHDLLDISLLGVEFDVDRVNI